MTVLKPEQLPLVGATPTSEQLAGLMTPEQNVSARAKLQGLESQTRDPAQLPFIAKGYVLLQAHDDALRIGEQLRELNPKQSQGFTITATASLHQGRYEEAARLAQEALARNPQDREAFTVLKMSEGRISAGSGGNPARPVNQTHSKADVPAAPGMPGKQPHTLSYKIKATAPPPTLTTVGDTSNAPLSPGTSPLLPLLAATGLTLATFGVLRSKGTWGSDNGLNPSPNISTEDQQRARTGSMILVGTFVVSFAALEFGPAAFTALVPMKEAILRSSTPRVGRALNAEGGNLIPSGRIAAQRAAQPGANLLQGGLERTAVLEQQFTQELTVLRSLGQPGSSPRIRLVEGGTREAQALFQQISRGGKILTGTNYPGTLTELPNGARVGLRLTSTSGPPTIDVHGFSGFAQDLEIKFIK